MSDENFIAKRLLELYDRVADAPDAIDRLRKFVLDLAVRGKLVEQDPEDEPASELLERVAAEKARLVKAGGIKRAKKLPPIEAEPFTLPANWHWVRIREVTSDRGQKVPDSEFTYLDVTAINKEAGVVAEPKVLSKDEAPSRARKIAAKGDIIYSCVRPYLLNVAVLDKDFDPEPIASTAFAVLNGHGFVLPWYLWIALRSPFMVECVEENQRGQAYPAINDKDFSLLPFPLPPLAEQHRIVEKVNELMSLLDRQESTRTNRETTRNRLTAASFARLTAPDTTAESFPTHARFALDTLPALTTRPEQIKSLRQTILNLAVRGKLVEQDPADEPASELLERVSRKFSELVAIGELKKPKPLNPLSTVDYLFELPNGWAFARFNAIASIESNLVDPKPFYEMPHIAPDNIESWNGKLLPYTTVGEAGVFSGKHHFKPGVLLYSKIRPNLAKVAKVDFEGLCSADMYPIFPLVNRDFLLNFMITPGFVEQAVSEENRVAMPKINQAALSDILVPIPPLAEQYRIVAKVDALMDLCDRLEATLAVGGTARGELFGVMLQQYLTQISEKELSVA